MTLSHTRNVSTQDLIPASQCPFGISPFLDYFHPGRHSLIECFFMTARVLDLGLLKSFSDFKHLAQDISRYEDMFSKFKALQKQTPSPLLQLDIDRLEKEIELYSQEKLYYEAQILRDGELIQQALSFYRLVLVWLVNPVGGFKMPLPSTCPKEFAVMPEHFVEDAMELLIFHSRIPKALDGVVLVIIASGFSICSGSSATASLFEGHQLPLAYLVRNLLKLYVDIEFTGGIFEKDTISQFLEYNKFPLVTILTELDSTRVYSSPVKLQVDTTNLHAL
ncbi:hypothetical protein SADUNF_Sadunf17G0073400 [Salix dunnii]|uniref:Ubiquitin conjugation factor E4 core domain-containing protein n=1 Tax=Salix dunnii TaxID=1413687 RepID=A0A835MHB1_9ROSI|nr:hypothetical protein SADUNF_Sadunf17G0073400 [Salix dunnii]